MTADELAQRLAALPPGTRPERQEAPEGPRPAAGPVRAAYAAMAPSTWTVTEEQIRKVKEDRERRDAQFRIERTAETRAALEGRIDTRLRAALIRTRSPCGLFLGPTGVGKTSAMAWLAAEWPGLQIHARELASSERRHGLGEGYPPEIRDARSVRVLYLDDIGTEEQRDLGALQFVLNHRYESGLATVATSGLTQEQLTAHIGAAYSRRLVDQHVRRKDGTEWPVLLVDMHKERV